MVSRPARIEFGGAVHRVMARGDRQEEVFRDERDRSKFLGLSLRIDDAPDAICYLRKVFCPSKTRCSLSVSSSAGNIDSMRNSCAATVCGMPTVVTIEK